MTNEPLPLAVELRAAVAADSRAIAPFFCMAGGGLYEFLFDDLVPFLTAVDFLSWGIGSEGYPISFRNCHVAIDRPSGEIVGVANAFAADDLKDQAYQPVPAERVNHVRGLLELRDPGSMFLNVLAVSAKCRGLGIGAKLLNWAQRHAEAAGFDRLSLHVWADNASAVKFYERQEFVAVGVALVAPHPRLVHSGGSVLMRRTIMAAKPADAPRRQAVAGSMETQALNLPLAPVTLS